MRTLSRAATATLLLVVLASCSGTPEPAGLVFVGNLASKDVSVFRAPSYEPVATIKLRGGPHGISVEPGGKRLWTANIDGNTASVVDVASLKVVRTIRTCGEPVDIAFAAGNAFVACGDGYMIVVSTSSFRRIARTAIGFGPHALLAGPGGHLWSANRGSNDLSDIDPATYKLLRRNPAAPFAYGLAFSPDGKYAYVTSKQWSSLVVLSMETKEILGAIRVGHDPALVVATGDGTRVYVANRGDNTVSVINARTFQALRTIGVGAEPDGLSLSPDDALLFVANNGAGTVSVIDTASETVLRVLTAGTGPNDIEFIPA